MADANLWVSETYINADKGYRYGEAEPYETFTDNPGELYRSLRKEYGRCTGNIFVDKEAGPQKVGWVFVKRVCYDDCKDTYLREVWVTVLDKPNTVTRTVHHHKLP
jgi:hypothetical protein